MADDKNTSESTTQPTPEPSSKDAKTIMEEYQKATPKERAKKFYVDPNSKTLRRK